MVTYKYTAISKDGTKVKGVMEAYDEMDAMGRIRETCDIVLSMNEVKEKKQSFLNMDLNANHLNSKAFVMMCSQFSIILHAGVPIGRTCQLIADKTTNKPLKRVIKQVADDVESGRSLAAALEDRGAKLFPVTFIETIRSGEVSGNLDTAFESMYQHYDKQAKMKRKVQQALIYPSFVLFIAVAVVAVLMIFVVPTFTSLFEGYDTSLPVITQILIAVSNFFRHYFWIIAVVIIIVIIAKKIYEHTEQGRLNLAKFSLKLPVLGNIHLLNDASQFANTMTTMLAAGVTLTNSLSITARVLSNYHISQEVGKLSGKLEAGHNLGSSLREAAVFPDILTDMVSVGEETGELQDTLDTVAKYYDAELDAAITSAVSKLEPALLIFVAFIAGFIVLAVYAAIFKLYGSM